MIPLIWTFFRRWVLRFQIVGLSAWNVLRLFWARAFNSVYFGAAVLAVLVLVGVIFGFAGYKLEAGWVIGLGQMLIATGGMIATGILAVFYLRSVVATHALVGLDALVAKLTFGRSGHFFTNENGANLRNDLLNAFAWIAAFCLWCDFVPVWKLPVAIPIGATLAMFFAFASAKSWTFIQKPFGKAVVFTFLAMMFLLHSANICLGGALTEWSSAKGDLGAAAIGAFAANDRGRQRIQEEKASFEESKTEVELEEYRTLARRQLKLMKNKRDAVREEEYRRNAQRMRVLEIGSHTRARAKTVSGETDGATNGFVNWASANWAGILICVFVVFLAVMLVVGLAAKQKWLAGAAFACLLLIGFCGLGYWASQRAGLSVSQAGQPQPTTAISSPTILPRQSEAESVQAGMPQSAPTRSLSVPPRPLGLRQGLDAIMPEEPGEWR